MKLTFYVYGFPSRDVAIIEGKSKILYPFYQSTGINSGSEETWFPWMGFLRINPQTKNSLYMVKPTPYGLSQSVSLVIKKYLGDTLDTANFIKRMGNDEALAISCSIGGGIWEKKPQLQKEIKENEAIIKYLQEIESGIYQKIELNINSAPKTEKFVNIHGDTGLVNPNEALVAHKMEEIVQSEYKNYPSNSWNIPQQKMFPTNSQTETILDEMKESIQSENADLSQQPEQNEFKKCPSLSFFSPSTTIKVKSNPTDEEFKKDDSDNDNDDFKKEIEKNNHSIEHRDSSDDSDEGMEFYPQQPKQN